MSNKIMKWKNGKCIIHIDIQLCLQGRLNGLSFYSSSFPKLYRIQFFWMTSQVQTRFKIRQFVTKKNCFSPKRTVQSTVKWMIHDKGKCHKIYKMLKNTFYSIFFYSQGPFENCYRLNPGGRFEQKQYF